MIKFIERILTRIYCEIMNLPDEQETHREDMEQQHPRPFNPMLKRPDPPTFTLPPSAYTKRDRTESYNWSTLEHWSDNDYWTTNGERNDSDIDSPHRSSH